MPPTIQRADSGRVVCLHIEDPSLPVVSFLVGFRQGAAHDGPGRTGTTAAMLDLCLRGSGSQNREEFSDALESLGSTLYADGGQEAVYLRGHCLARNLESTWDLLVQALAEPAFKAQEVEELRDEAIEELRNERDDDSTLAVHFLREPLYGDHPFARHASGSIDDLRKLEPDRVRAVHRERCAAEVIVAATGDVDAATLGRLIERLEAALPPLAPAAPALAIPVSPGPPQLIIVDKPERTQAQILLAQLVCDGRSPRALPLWLGVVAFGGTFTSPFTHEVREVRGWSYSASAGYDRRRNLAGNVVLGTAPALGDAVDCLALEWELFTELARGEMPPAALARARAYLHNRFPFEVATAADLLLPAVRLELLGLPMDQLFALPEDLDALEDPTVFETLRQELEPGRLVGTIVGTAAAIEAPLRQRFPDLDIRVVDYRHGLD